MRAAQPRRASPGRLVLDQPHGRRPRSSDALPPLLRGGDATPATRSCGRATRCTATRSPHASGYKTRDFDDVMRELARVLRRVHARRRLWPGGVHIELTGENVTECLGGSRRRCSATTSSSATRRCATRASTPASRSTSRSRSPSCCVADGVSFLDCWAALSGPLPCVLVVLAFEFLAPVPGPASR